MKNNQGKETDMKGNPSGRTKSLDNFIIIAGGISAGAKVEGKEMNGYPQHQQQSGNPLQKPRPETSFFYIHYFLPQSTPSTQRRKAEVEKMGS